MEKRLWRPGGSRAAPEVADGPDQTAVAGGRNLGDSGGDGEQCQSLKTFAKSSPGFPDRRDVEYESKRG